MHVDEFLKKENREALARELTKEGLFELKEETIRGNSKKENGRLKCK